MLGYLEERAHAVPILPKWEQKVILEPNTGCVLWVEGLCSSGYPQVRFGKGSYRLHRLLVLGTAAYANRKLFVCHKCNQKECVNTEHLYLGNSKTNHLDQVAAGTYRLGERGELNVRAKLTPAKVKDIRQRLRNKEKQAAIGYRYGVSQHAITCIATGKTWGWLK